MQLVDINLIYGIMFSCGWLVLEQSIQQKKIKKKKQCPEKMTFPQSKYNVFSALQIDVNIHFVEVFLSSCMVDMQMIYSEFFLEGISETIKIISEAGQARHQNGHADNFAQQLITVYEQALKFWCTVRLTCSSWKSMWIFSSTKSKLDHTHVLFPFHTSAENKSNK